MNTLLLVVGVVYIVGCVCVFGFKDAERMGYDKAKREYARRYYL